MKFIRTLSLAMTTWFCFILSVILPIMSKEIDDINNKREEMLQKELAMMLGSDIVLSDSEVKANEVIMDLKYKELDDALNHPKAFNMSQHFFDYKDKIKNTELFKLLQRMPKGAVLHAHDTGILSPDYVLEITYMNDLYVCFGGESVQFQFSKKTPTNDCKTQWLLMKDARYSSRFGSVKKFDQELRKSFTIVVDNPNGVYTDINVVWQKFQQYFITTSALFCYKPVWEKYFYDTLKALREDNVMYIEIRSVLPPLYDLDGNVFDTIATAETYKKVVDQFVKDYPDFMGAKLIYAPLRLVGKDTVDKYIQTAKELKKKLPDFFAGFDLVGQEDLGTPLKEFLPQFLKAGKDLDYFFHAGETNCYGTSSDENLLDAIVLNTKRIGHAFALVKHPLLLEEVKKRKIAIEVNVISNAVLKLVDDIRNHPLAAFLAKDVPVVLSSDDPGVWEADPLTHDFYVAFVGVASRHADLRLLKKLALNSLHYSSYPNKDQLVYEFEVRWKVFVDAVVKDKNLK